MERIKICFLATWNVLKIIFLTRYPGVPKEDTRRVIPPVILRNRVPVNIMGIGSLKNTLMIVLFMN